MTSGEIELVEWLTAGQSAAPAVTLGIGDDMAILEVAAPRVLVTTDMLLDGVHFDRARHDPQAIGHKALACGLSDCAAMAVRPAAATVSLALPGGWSADDSRNLYRGIRATADAFECAVVGGDTNAWAGRLAIDVTVVAVPYPGLAPVRRSGASVGDGVFVTGALGGSRLGRHMTFTPRVREARCIVESLGPAVHAMMDISDGLSLDLGRMCAASGVGAILEESRLTQVVHPDAVESQRRDGRSPLEHVLSDGEDFELLLAVAPEAAVGHIDGATLHRIGTVVASGLSIRGTDGAVRPLAPRGFEHRT